MERIASRDVAGRLASLAAVSRVSGDGYGWAIYRANGGGHVLGLGVAWRWAYYGFEGSRSFGEAADMALAFGRCWRRWNALKGGR